MQVKLEELNVLSEKYARYQEILKVPVASYEDLEDVKQDLALKKALWESRASWDAVTEGWRKTEFNEYVYAGKECYYKFQSRRLGSKKGDSEF